MTHFDWIMNTFDIIASDRATLSVLFYAEGELCCEINGYQFSCENESEFWDLIEQFGDVTTFLNIKG